MQQNSLIKPKPKRPVVKETASDTVQSIPESRPASAANSEQSTKQTESGTQKPPIA